jgi:hypothetical protein
MLAVEEFRPARTRPIDDADGGGRSSVMIVCSARPRAGKTLVARLLTEFFLTDNRPVAAFDVNPNDPLLLDYLPAYTEFATVTDTPGQMALFDRMIINDGIPKVVDVASEQFATFFGALDAIGFVEAAEAQSINTIVLFLAENHPRSIEAFGQIQEGLPRATLVPVHNEVIEGDDAPKLPNLAPGIMPVRVPHLPPYLLGVVKKPTFSFSKFLSRPAQFPTLLHKWISEPFIGFRNLELRQSLADFAPLFRRSA